MSVLRNSMTRWAVGALSAGAMIVGTIAPAAARHKDYRGGYYNGYGYSSAYRHYRPYKHYRHHRHRRGPSAGDVIGIAVLLGTVAVIASAASKDKKTRRRSDDRPDYRHDQDYRSDSRSRDRDVPKSDGYALNQDEAIDICVNAARDKAEANAGGYAEILDVAQPQERGSGDWDIEGRLEQRRSYSDKKGETKRFSCDVREGRVAYVYISRDVV